MAPSHGATVHADERVCAASFCLLARRHDGIDRVRAVAPTAVQPT